MKSKFCYWNSLKRKMVDDEGIILHWGTDYEVTKDVIAHFTVVFIADSEGIVRKVLPTDIQIISENNK